MSAAVVVILPIVWHSETRIRPAAEYTPGNSLTNKLIRMILGRIHILTCHVLLLLVTKAQANPA